MDHRPKQLCYLEKYTIQANSDVPFLVQLLFSSRCPCYTTWQGDATYWPIITDLHLARDSISCSAAVINYHFHFQGHSKLSFNLLALENSCLNLIHNHRELAAFHDVDSAPETHGSFRQEYWLRPSAAEEMLRPMMDHTSFVSGND